MAKIALLIGVSEYEPGFNPLSKAVADVRAMQQVLQHPDLGGFAESDVTALLNPTRQEMEEAIFYLFDKRKKDDLLLFYFSGHGIRDENGIFYLASRLTRIEQGTLISPTAVEASFLHKNMNASRSRRQVVILDCCFSGAFAQGMVSKDASTVNVKSQLGGEGRAILASSTSTQYAFEQEGTELSIYTHFLVEGIETGAADLDSDCWISADELHEYARSKVHESAPAMTPEFYGVREGHKILLAKARVDDPKLKYRKEAEHYNNRGEISPVGRIILDTRRVQLGLSLEEAKAIEEDVLRPFRQRLENLQRYGEAFVAAIKDEYPLKQETRNELNYLQGLLGLRDKDVAAIEQEVTSQFAEKIEDAAPTPLSSTHNGEDEQVQFYIDAAPMTLKSEETSAPIVQQEVDNSENSLTQPDELAGELPEQRQDFASPEDGNSQRSSTAVSTIPKTFHALMGLGIGLGVLVGVGVGLYHTWLPPAKVELMGAGATFPAPLYQRWFSELKQKQPQLAINYDAIGSGAGVDRLITGTVDFGASDTAMTYPEIQQVNRGVLLLPMTAGSIALAYNIPYVETGLKLPRDVYVDIFLGKIKTWNDPKIAKANPNIKLPNLEIQVVYRSESSGTTGVFTKHLSAISREWRDKVGEGQSVKWPIGVGARGNQGVSDRIQQVQGAITYIEYSYAKNNYLKVAALENKEGNYFSPSEGTVSQTIEAVELPENFRGFISDPGGQESYPIVTYTWLLVYENYPDPKKAKAVEMMIEYGLTEGQTFSKELGYVPLPPNIIERVAAAADRISSNYQIKTRQ